MGEIWDGFMANKALLVVAILVFIDIVLFIVRFVFGIITVRRSSKQYAEEMVRSEQRMQEMVDTLNSQHEQFVDQLTMLKKDISGGG